MHHVHEANYDRDITIWKDENRRLMATINEFKASKNESTTVKKSDLKEDVGCWPKPSIQVDV